MTARTTLALVGAGGFGHFVARSAQLVPAIEIVAVVDADTSRAAELASSLGARTLTYAQVLADPTVDAVAIVAPPHTHVDLATRAIAAGKDVFCEKPLGADMQAASALCDMLAGSDRVFVVDHVLRYNPLLATVRRIQDLMQWKPLRFLFENDAADESLPRDHWFWEQSRSGGIFVEHGVHFFDAARMFIDADPASVVAAATRRVGWPAADIVSATVVHGDCLATHTHSFAHAHRCERQLMRLDFGAGEARIYGWIPVQADLRLHTDIRGEERLRDLLSSPQVLTMPGVELPAGAIQIDSTAVDGAPTASGRGQPFAASRMVTIRMTLGGEPAKPQVYAASVAAALQDLHDCRDDRSRTPRSNVVTAAAAVAVAEAATRAAETGREVTFGSD